MAFCVGLNLPYRGERDLFKCKPSTWTTVIPAAELGNDELKFTFERADENVGATKLALQAIFFPEGLTHSTAKNLERYQHVWTVRMVRFRASEDGAGGDST